MKNIQEKLIISGIKIKEIFNEAKSKAKKKLKDNTGSIINYILIMAIGVIVIALIFWPVIEDVSRDLIVQFETWWDNIQSDIFSTPPQNPGS